MRSQNAKMRRRNREVAKAEEPYCYRSFAFATLHSRFHTFEVLPSTFLLAFSKSRSIADVLEIHRGTVTVVIIEGGDFFHIQSLTNLISNIIGSGTYWKELNDNEIAVFIQHSHRKACICFSLNNLIILFLYSYCQEQREATTIILQYTTNGIGKLSDQRYLLAFHWLLQYNFKRKVYFWSIC